MRPRQTVWQQLGLAEQHTNNLAPAVEAYSKALDLDPKNDVVRNSYSALLIETRQPERGIQEAEKVLAHSKADTSAQMNIGYASENGRLRESRKGLSRRDFSGTKIGCRAL